MAKTDDTKPSPTLDKAHAHMACAQGDCNAASVGAYSAPSFDLSREAWEKAAHENKQRGKQWKETVEGRGAIRLFSRGVLGALGFALGSSMARSYGRGYNPNLGGYRYSWDRIAEEAAKEGVWHKTAGKFVVHGIARTYDDIFGTAIKALGNAVGKNGQEWVTFRPTRMYKNYDKTGRSLGQEVVGVTLDFATMSVGDAFGRDVADWMDPNAKHDIYDKKGNVDPSKVLTSSAKALWRYVSYNAGEDWAVAVPYVYFMRGQRGLLNKWDPGFAYDSDRALNGASFKLDDHGRIIGNYNATGALDLQTRFTVYNIGTLMFREMYSELGDRIHWYQHTRNPVELLQTHHNNEGRTEFSRDPVKASLETLDRVANWAMRSVIKGTLYMTPAVPFFWATRTPQMKYRGTFIHPENGIVTFKNRAGQADCLHAYEARRTQYHGDSMPRDTQFYYAKSNAYYADFNPHEHMKPISFNPLEDPSHNRHKPNGTVDWKEFDPFAKTYGVFDTAIQPLGKASDVARKLAHKPVRMLSGVIDHIAPHPSGKPVYVRDKWKAFTDQMVSASFAYTPYFFMKSDVAGYYWDTGKMDFSIDSMLEGVKTLNYQKTSRGLGEIWDTMWGNPLKDPEREVAAQKARCNDISLSDGISFRADRTKCLENALEEICNNERYQSNPATRHYVDQLKAQRERGRVVDITEPKKDNPDKPISFTERHGKSPSMEPPKRDEGFVAKEVERHSKDPFPAPGSILH